MLFTVWFHLSLLSGDVAIYTDELLTSACQYSVILYIVDSFAADFSSCVSANDTFSHIYDNKLRLLVTYFFLYESNSNIVVLD